MSVEKVALITAGGSGMGADAARRLAADGFRVGILSSSGKGEELGKELGGFGVTGSNRSPDDLATLVEGARDRWGRVDVLVNSAGHGPKGEYPKAWGNCVLMVMLAEIVDGFCTRNLPAEDPPFGHQSDDLATRLGFLVHHLA